jgi:hypothetical protein
MEPAEDRPDDPANVPLPLTLLDAAMEPAEDRPDDGSRNLSRLTCANGALCERSVLLRSKVILYRVVKVRKHRLTCVRALPRVRLTTSVLA